MNTRSTMRAVAGIAAAGLAVGALAGCAAGDQGGDADSGDVTITWWHNGTGEPLKSFWEDVAKEFEGDHPGVQVKVEAFQNEDLQRTLIPNALQAGGDAAPDLFMVWAEGEIKSQVEAGYLKDLSGLTDVVDSVGGAGTGWNVDGKQYGIPFRYGIEGLWYNQELFDQAGITDNPATFDELTADVNKLSEAGVAPIGVGAGDGWPAAHWWYQFAIKTCSPESLKEAADTLTFDDPCFVKAGENLKTWMDGFSGDLPFQSNPTSTPAQSVPNSSAGLLASGATGMELMGTWHRGEVAKLVPGAPADNPPAPEWLKWMPVPDIEGAEGAPGAALGSGDAWGVYKDAPDATLDLLEYVMSPDVQKRFAATGEIPTVKGAEAGITDPVLKQIAEGTQNASVVVTWLDTQYGPVIGKAMNDAIVNLMFGDGTPQSVPDAMNAAAATL
ncbi:ABC transporter substrate-binding protein [Microbacterium ulmi]|uniref:Extracellular solute-binding protein n=1 Tax=Microbacterium ulmi TaxID=179095 RepID=A0A7Y2M3T7_9MICO|nr:extracellular solute-binding protein [Microbacterium ulmi]NII69992.1 raffinose/stachyose/melibiose transport system substrate-binding protein [Microbacterium ulmi]NNH04578.1 extracellular solute-binding protein [Microbacterium ulmi]